MINDYKYVALTHEGKRIKGTFEAPSKKILVDYLYDKGLNILEIEEYSNLFTKLSKITVGKTIKNDELIFILKQLSSMMKAGMRSVDSLEVIASQTQQKIVKRILFDIYFEVASGKRLSEAFSKYPKDFPSLLINMIRNGEKSGDLITTVDNIADYYERNREIRNDVIGALSMPTAYILMAIGVSIMVVTVVLPNYVGLFETNDVEMPAITQALLDVSHFFFDYGSYLAVGALLFSILFYLIFYRTEKGKTLLGRILIQMPIFGKIVVMFNLSIIASTLSQMVVNHVNLLDAIKATATITKNAIYKERLLKVADNVENGYAISRAMENHYAFTPIFTKMISLGEKSGSLDDMLHNLAKFYTTDVKFQIKKLRKRIEPALMIFIYALVGGLVLAVMMPSFSMMQSL
ncbi:type II secretion system F family protein [Mycoplasmatota bacterium zrk1]